VSENLIWILQHFESPNLCMQDLFYKIWYHIVKIHCSRIWIAHILHKSNNKVLEILAVKSENLGDIFFSFVLSDSALWKKFNAEYELQVLWSKNFWPWLWTLDTALSLPRQTVLKGGRGKVGVDKWICWRQKSRPDNTKKWPAKSICKALKHPLPGSFGFLFLFTHICTLMIVKETHMTWHIVPLCTLCASSCNTGWG
jgi:hypothetical protein